VCRSFLLFDRNVRWPRRLLLCCLVSHSKYADGTDRQTDRRTDVNVITGWLWWWTMQECICTLYTHSFCIFFKIHMFTCCLSSISFYLPSTFIPILHYPLQVFSPALFFLTSSFLHHLVTEPFSFPAFSTTGSFEKE